MTEHDLSLPRSKALAGARARGFDARLGGQSFYANPYADAIERGGKGWSYAFLNAWWEGWCAADTLLPSDKLSENPTEEEPDGS